MPDPSHVMTGVTGAALVGQHGLVEEVLCRVPRAGGFMEGSHVVMKNIVKKHIRRTSG